MEASAEVNNVEGSSEPPPKDEAVEVESEAADASKTEDVDKAPQLTQSDKSAVSDKSKELTWEKIAAEFTEDEEEPMDVKVEEKAPPEPQKDQETEPASTDTVEITRETVEITRETVEITRETVDSETVNTSVTESESSEKTVEEISIEITREEVEPQVEDQSPVEDETQPVELPPEPPLAEPIETASVKEVDEVMEEPPTEEEAQPAAEVVAEESSTKESEKVAEQPGADESAEEDVVVEGQNVEEVVEITELKPDEVATAESTDTEEYTVIEAEDEVETNEIIEQHLAQTTATETVVIINPDQSQTEITIEQIEEGDKSEEIYIINKDSEAGVDDPLELQEQEVREAKPKKQRGRKPIADIPLHVLGRDITKPTEGVSNGGRTMPKPRLGVKVPYRNLTSQIVSKEEIEKEIMERFKLKQEQNSTTSGDILFARKLTQRLAKKLIPSEREKPTPKPPEPTTSISKQTQPEMEIKNNSDLIAILEGEGEEITVKNTEKEIALQQLKELPVSKNKIFKTKSEEEKTPPPPPPKNPPPTETPPSPVKSPPSEKKNQQQEMMEPRLKTGMVIKTYTRKRKSSDLETILPPKKSVVMATTIKSEDGPPTNVYITKSSRVIKRKVIWDPDEIPPAKSPQVKSPKPDTGSPPKSPNKAPKVEAAAVSPSSSAVKPAPEKKVPVPVKKAAVSKSPPPKKPKRLSEVDKLLMDEGAVNMLYDVKTNDDSSQDKLKMKNSNKSVISLDKAHKELMSKTKVIRNDLQQNTNKDVQQKLLRKKEVVPPSPSPPKKEAPSPPKKETATPPKKETPSPKKEPAQQQQPVPVSRKKSKDSSARSSVHSPPSSPAYNAAEASRIIRRHSSSSFSSNDEEVIEDAEKDATATTKKKVAAAAAASAESPKKKLKKNSDAKPAKEVAKNNNNTVTESKAANHADEEFEQYKTFATTRKNKLVAIKLHKENTYFTEQVLKELTSCLKDLGKDDDCHVVSFTSASGDSFCRGLDYRCLVVDDEQVRKKKATELSTLVKEFLRCLLNFPKVLVAGIQGDCVGLGVTMLPLFDMVVASDTSTFSTPYAKVGCIPEAGFLLTVPHLSSHGLASELLYTAQVVKAEDAFRRGLVTRLCWPEKYSEELKSMLALVASQPRQSIVATKQQLRHHLVQSTESALNAASKALIEHWTSPECQKKFFEVKIG